MANVERMNWTIKEAAVKRYHYDRREQLETHLADFINAYNYSKRFKTLGVLGLRRLLGNGWRQRPGHVQGEHFALRDAPAPNRAKLAPRTKRVHEGKTRGANLMDQGWEAGVARKHPGFIGLRRAGIDRIVEQSQVLPGRKPIAIDRFPIIRRIDFRDLIVGNLEDVLCRETFAGAICVISRMRDAAAPGPAAAVPWRTDPVDRGEATVVTRPRPGHADLARRAEIQPRGYPRCAGARLGA